MNELESLITKLTRRPTDALAHRFLLRNGWAIQKSVVKQGVYQMGYNGHSMFNAEPDWQKQVGTKTVNEWIALKDGEVWQGYNNYPETGRSRKAILYKIVNDEFRMLTWGGRDDVGSALHWIKRNTDCDYGVIIHRNDTFTFSVGSIHITDSLGRAALITVMAHKRIW